MTNFSTHGVGARRDDAARKEVEMRKMDQNPRRSRTIPLLLVTLAALVMILPLGITSVRAAGCYTVDAYWTPAAGINYSESATACIGRWIVSSSANSATLVPQNGTYLIQACFTPSYSLAYCDSSNDVFSRTFTTGQGVFPNQSIRYNDTNANTFTVELDVTVLYTTTGVTNTVSSYTCVTSALHSYCPL